MRLPSGTASAPSDAPSLSTTDDQRARTLLTRHRADVLRCFVRYRIPPADRDDLLQDVIFAACLAWSTYDATRGPVAPWLYAIARNHARNYWRRPLHRHEELRDHGEMPDVTEEARSSEDLLADEDRRRLLERMLAALPPEQREILIRHALDELSMPEVARHQGLNLNSAWSRFNDALRACRGWFRRWRASERTRGRDGLPILLLPFLHDATPTPRAARHRAACAGARSAASVWASLGRTAALIVTACTLSAPAPSPPPALKPATAVVSVISPTTTLSPPLASVPPRPGARPLPSTTRSGTSPLPAVSTVFLRSPTYAQPAVQS
ncbi:RNA polymerase sigma factor [Chondromyces apiculatus]|uniref:Putative RNA polymerase sigma factor n=1 Tax=Chondromyces apiculatus DSM 436 TaxID=1192034 RepID=A0A017TCB5_9BACT|nr:RNA polymerase sigma factor [Chondromyces apiculatus]EYF06450.1 putative RNA polymerase sigma factor [Chondromyces apiculatus DSM 436]